jgi:hypothetical protein
VTKDRLFTVWRFLWKEKKQDYMMEDARGPSTATQLVEVVEAELELSGGSHRV